MEDVKAKEELQKRISKEVLRALYLLSKHYDNSYVPEWKIVAEVERQTGKSVNITNLKNLVHISLEGQCNIGIVHRMVSKGFSLKHSQAGSDSRSQFPDASKEIKKSFISSLQHSRKRKFANRDLYGKEVQVGNEGILIDDNFVATYKRLRTDSRDATESDQSSDNSINSFIHEELDQHLEKICFSGDEEDPEIMYEICSPRSSPSVQSLETSNNIEETVHEIDPSGTPEKNNFEQQPSSQNDGKSSYSTSGTTEETVHEIDPFGVPEKNNSEQRPSSQNDEKSSASTNNCKIEQSSKFK
uniref:Uncharacterized protein n=1 Tax=Glossina brevipalpis TaxID=37001 RepID=A0A1A9WKZ7_9MUSC